MPGDDRKLVYSSESGWSEPPKTAKKTSNNVKQGRPSMPDDGTVRIARERRRASTVSIVTGLSAGEMDEVAKALKRHCGTGGTAKNGVVEIQGDHRDKIAGWFAAQGRKTKLAGG
jgi:translation initiation factor 1